MKGGLLHLDSSRNADEVELPFASIEAENSILSTANRDVPLFKLDRNEHGDDFDKIHWSGRKVAYDHIQTYRTDEVHQTGVSPTIYDRPNWSTAFRPTDESPILTELKFLKTLDPNRGAWQLDRDDFKLAPKAATTDNGPDLDRVPAAPPTADL